MACTEWIAWDMARMGWDFKDVRACREMAQDYFNDVTYENATHLRYARSWVQEEVDEYHNVRESGCCGCYERIVDGTQGQIFFGFNYGH